MIHIPVLKKEVLKSLDPKPNENFIDATFGSGGHTLLILEKNGPKGKVLGIEWDPELLKITKSKIKNKEFKKRLILAQGNFADLKEIARKNNFKDVSGVLIDLGFSSWHIEKSNRGFTFQKNEELDMRFDPGSGITAKQILNQWQEKKIENILKKYGEERFAKRIARNICQKRKTKPINTTFELVKIIKESVPLWYQRQRINPATRTFQALRIAVNDELNNLKKCLPQALEVLKPNGRLAVISFHSLEDRIVKNFFKEKSKQKLVKILFKKPIVPSREEIKKNPRSRSAKLRAVQKII